MRYFFLITLIFVIGVISIAGYRGMKTERRPLEFFPDMRRQPKYKPQKPSEFFADGEAARMPIPDTVAIQMPAHLDYRNTGKMGNMWGDGLPIDIDEIAMRRGQERYQINCQVCHGAAALGNGITSKFGLNGIANLQQDRIVQMADGEIFNTITNGKGLMNPYGANVGVDDRWKIIAYLRALQKSQHTLVADLSPSMRSQLPPASPVPATTPVGAAQVPTGTSAATPPTAKPAPAPGTTTYPVGKGSSAATVTHSKASPTSAANPNNAAQNQGGASPSEKTEVNQIGQPNQMKKNP